MHLYYRFTLDFDFICVGEVGDFEAGTLVLVESSLKYHPCKIDFLTLIFFKDSVCWVV